MVRIKISKITKGTLGRRKILLFIGLGIIALQVLGLIYFNMPVKENTEAAKQLSTDPKYIMSMRQLTKINILTAIDNFKNDNGRCPKILSEMVPKYLYQLPMDALSGTPFSYEAKEDGSCVVDQQGQDIEERYAMRNSAAFKAGGSAILSGDKKLSGSTPKGTVKPATTYKDIQTTNGGEFFVSCNTANEKIDRCSILIRGAESSQLQADEVVHGAQRDAWLRRLESDAIIFKDGEGTGKARAYIDDNGRAERRIVDVNIKLIGKTDAAPQEQSVVIAVGNGEPISKDDGFLSVTRKEPDDYSIFAYVILEPKAES
jgi:hypothetical protein